MSGVGKSFSEKLVNNISNVIVGRDEVIRLCLTALIADGHVLLEDVPGTGKTKLAKSLAASLSCEFSRIQFTPDLLPGDIVGVNIFDKKSGEFVFKKGPVFTNVLLADEINRATPRTQSGLLECMEEKQVTVDGVRYVPGEPFFVIATQNPIETAGTFPLPEAQLDRFIMKLSMGLPNVEEEFNLLSRFDKSDPLANLKTVVTMDELFAVRKEANEVFVSDDVRKYMVSIVEKTRKSAGIAMGVSPRGSLALQRCAKAYAYLDGRDFVTPDDVKKLVKPVLGHRIISEFGNSTNSLTLLDEILGSTPVPTEEFDK